MCQVECCNIPEFYSTVAVAFLYSLAGFMQSQTVHSQQIIQAAHGLYSSQTSKNQPSLQEQFATFQHGPGPASVITSCQVLSSRESNELCLHVFLPCFLSSICLILSHPRSVRTISVIISIHSLICSSTYDSFHTVYIYIAANRFYFTMRPPGP